MFLKKQKDEEREQDRGRSVIDLLNRHPGLGCLFKFWMLAPKILKPRPSLTE